MKPSGQKPAFDPTEMASLPPWASTEVAPEIERMAILQTLQRTNWNKQEAAHILGFYRPTLYSKMRKHNIEDPGRAARAARDAREAELVSREAEGS